MACDIFVKKLGRLALTLGNFYQLSGANHVEHPLF
jgi:hypothetical protein